MRFIQLTFATGRYRVERVSTDQPQPEPHSGEDDLDGEEDALDNPPATEQVEITQPILINVDNISHFHPRREPRVGTRIRLKNSAAIPVTETVEQVQALLAQVNN